MRRGYPNSHTLLFWFSIFVKPEVCSCEINSLFVRPQSNMLALNKDVFLLILSVCTHCSEVSFASETGLHLCFLGFFQKSCPNLAESSSFNKKENKLKSHVSEKLQSTEGETWAVR